MKRLFMLLLFAVPLVAFAQQVRGRVTDVHSGEPLAFVAITEAGTGRGAYSDIDGFFVLQLSGPHAMVVFQLTGYQVVSLPWNGKEVWEVQLHPSIVTTAEVVIRPGENPAERIMQRVIDRKAENDPERNRAFSYDSYNKLVFTTNMDSSVWADEARYRSYATDDREVVDFFRDKHLFLMESASHRRFLPPDRTEEKILASRVSGMKNPEFFLLGTQLQSFSFYGEEVSILDTRYLSPLSKVAIRKYLFILEDTTMVDSDTVYTISFRPRKGTNYDGMKGQLFISTRGYALRNVIAQPYEEDAALSIRIQQQYQWTEGGWFPEQLNSFLELPQVKLGEWHLIGVGRSYIRNLSFDPDARPSDFGPVVLLMDPDALAQPDSVWVGLREHPLDQRELNTYATIDSVGEAIGLDRRMQVVSMLTTGRWPIGVVSVDLDRILRFNDYEGWRLGAGLHTNDFLSKRFSIGGYYAYGFRDKAHKYGGDLLLHLHRPRDTWMRFFAERDVVETGGRVLQPRGTSLSMLGNLYPLFVNRMDNYERWGAELNGRAIGNLTTTLFGQVTYTDPFRGARLYLPAEGTYTAYVTSFSTTEVGAHVRWAPGEKLARVGDREVRLGGRFPVVLVKYTRGLQGVLQGEYDFDKWEVQADKTFRIRNTGSLGIRVSAGQVSTAMPASLLFNARGTNTVNYDEKTFMGIVAPYTFQVMRTNEFMHDRFFAVFVRHDFRDLLFSRPKFAPHISLQHAMLWGSLSDPGRYDLPLQAASEGYFESGIAFDRLLVSNFSGFGLGFFYRYGPLSAPEAKDNFIVKLSSSLSF